MIPMKVFGIVNSKKLDKRGGTYENVSNLYFTNNYIVTYKELHSIVRIPPSQNYIYNDSKNHILCVMQCLQNQRLGRSTL